MKITEFDGITGETIERKATAKEIIELQKVSDAADLINAAKMEKEATKAAVLEKLGLTQQELLAALS